MEGERAGEWGSLCLASWIVVVPFSSVYVRTLCLTLLRPICLPEKASVSDWECSNAVSSECIDIIPPSREEEGKKGSSSISNDPIIDSFPSSPNLEPRTQLFYYEPNPAIVMTHKNRERRLRHISWRKVYLDSAMKNISRVQVWCCVSWKQSITICVPYLQISGRRMTAPCPIFSISIFKSTWMG